jgi:hypothetical protein
LWTTVRGRRRGDGLASTSDVPFGWWRRPSSSTRNRHAPEFNEYGDRILADIGFEKPSSTSRSAASSPEHE